MVTGETKHRIFKGFSRKAKRTVFCRPVQCSLMATSVSPEEGQKEGPVLGWEETLWDRGSSWVRGSFTKSLEHSVCEALCQALGILSLRTCSGLRRAHGQLLVSVTLKCFRQSH